MGIFWLTILIVVVVIIGFYIASLEEQVENDDNCLIVENPVNDEDYTMDLFFEEPKDEDDLKC